MQSLFSAQPTSTRSSPIPSLPTSTPMILSMSSTTMSLTSTHNGCGNDMLYCMPEENIKTSDTTELTGNLLRDVGWKTKVPSLPSEKLPTITLYLSELESKAPHLVEELFVSGNIASVKIEFYENGNFVLHPKYDLVDATKPIIFKPPIETLYLRVTYLEAIPMISGTLPLTYNATFSLTGCLSFPCGRYNLIYTLIVFFYIVNKVKFLHENL